MALEGLITRSGSYEPTPRIDFLLYALAGGEVLRLEITLGSPSCPDEMPVRCGCVDVPIAAIADSACPPRPEVIAGERFYAGLAVHSMGNEEPHGRSIIGYFLGCHEKLFGCHPSRRILSHPLSEPYLRNPERFLPHYAELHAPLGQVFSRPEAQVGQRPAPVVRDWDLAARGEPTDRPAPLSAANPRLPNYHPTR